MEKSRMLRTSHRFPPMLRRLTAVGLALVGLSAVGCTRTLQVPAPQAASQKSEVTGGESKADSVHESPSTASTPEIMRLEAQWGIRIVAIRLSAGGYMLDFRFRVADTEKAAPLFDRAVHPYLIDQASGAKMAVPSPPKVGPMRTSDPPQANRAYFIFFANPGRYIKQGNKVTVVIGDFRAENLIVE